MFIISMEISITLKTHSTKLQSFSKNWYNFHIDQSKGKLVKRQLKMLGMVQRKLCRTTLSNDDGDAEDDA